MNGWLTTILIVLPAAGALLVAIAPLSTYWLGSLAALLSLVEVAFWITAAGRFDFGSADLQLAQRHSWFSDLHVSWHVGQYAFSLWFVGMTVVCMAACTIYGWWVGRDRGRAYFALMLLLTAAIVGVFTAQDLLLFYAFFEAMLIPLYILIGVWGGSDRMRATITFVIYTVVGSLLMLASIVILGLKEGTFDLTKMHPSTSSWLFLGFVVAFAIKSPLFPFHGWLPLTYRESPPEVAGVLSGVVGKAGLYGLLRIVIPLFPSVVHDWRGLLLFLSACSLIYGSFLAFRAPDFRGVVMYSSLAQAGLIGLGLFANNSLGFDGAVLQIVNHALVSTSLFLVAGMVERRTSTGEFALLGGMARGRPALATLVMTIGIISLAVPLSTTFAGEFLILAGVFQQGWGWAVVGAVAMVLAAMYMLRAISGVLHQDVGPAVSERATDLRLGELAIVVPLVLCLLGLSAWPNLVTHRAMGGNQRVAITVMVQGPGACITTGTGNSFGLCSTGTYGWTRYAP
ncbi:MAG TPA: NADH-quinone oxidoreductase subunit M [Gaiellaceae bacterium]|nr:NADH-quinone oxidoreductase subunit M [Gaiellaceae bacterium]